MWPSWASRASSPPSGVPTAASEMAFVLQAAAPAMLATQASIAASACALPLAQTVGTVCMARVYVPAASAAPPVRLLSVLATVGVMARVWRAAALAVQATVDEIVAIQ